MNEKTVVKIVVRICFYASCFLGFFITVLGVVFMFSLATYGLTDENILRYAPRLVAALISLIGVYIPCRIGFMYIKWLKIEEEL